MTRPRLAVLVSGGGRTLENLFERIEAGRLPVEIPLVLGSRAGAFGLERARRRGVATALVERAAFDDDRSFSEALARALLPASPDLVALAGFVHLFLFPPSLRGKVMNVHPALLPSFGGKGFFGERVHRAVLESGAKVSGCTVHYATHAYDAGPIILQRTVPVLDDDSPSSLAARVFEAEREAYPEAIRLHIEGRLRVEGNRVRVLPPPA
ncbi:MAG TPA: phosphoribosylglycinamide formyltransferase [Planctomycetota bacterium]|nr:phosphoribosylglycinamide formyltransferase [Planctomycetota bacterium]